MVIRDLIADGVSHNKTSLIKRLITAYAVKIHNNNNGTDNKDNDKKMTIKIHIMIIIIKMTMGYILIQYK